MPTLFISCVSNEFGNYREHFRKKFERPNLQAKIQEDFNAYGGPTIHKLDDYIQNSVAIIHICGDMTGSMVNKSSLDYINNKYKDFRARFPALQPVLEGNIQASYTQWEAYMAAYHNKEIFVVIPTGDLKRSDAYKKEQHQVDCQLAHLKILKASGNYPEISFGEMNELVAELYRSHLSEILNAIPNIQPINLPYQTIGNDFKGREMFMAELYRELSASTGNAAAVAVHGLGGMGKTRLAVEYAWQHQNDYTALLFINAGSAELLKTNIAALSGQRALNLPEHEGKEEDVKYSAVINWLNQYSRWLLVLDNADTKEAAKKVEEVFAQLQHGHVIITTRVDSWSRQIKKKRIDVLSRDAATSFLLETTMAEREKNSNDEELAAGIAADLGYLALALEQARAYIVTKELSFDQYRKNWDKNKTSVLSWFDAQQMQYPASVAITWQTSFSQLSHPAMALLRRLSWLAPDPIPKTLFEVEVPDTRPIDAIGAWQELKQYSLASSSEDKKAFTVHKLVQDVTRSKLNNSEASKKLGEAVNWLDAAFTGDPTNVHEWPQLEPLVPHILTLLDHTKKQETGNSFSRLINNVALLFYTKAQYKMAEPLMRRVTEIYKQSFGEDHPKVALALNNLAPLLQATNRLEEAESLMRKALKIDEQSFGENHPNVARDVNNLAQLLKNTNRLEEAAPLMRRALFIVVTTLGFDHPNTQTIGNNYVFLLQQMGKSEEEIEIILSSLS